MDHVELSVLASETTVDRFMIVLDRSDRFKSAAAKVPFFRPMRALNMSNPTPVQNILQNMSVPGS